MVRRRVERRAATTRLAFLLPGAGGLILLYVGWTVLQIGGHGVSSFVTYFGEAASTVITLVVTGLRARVEARRDARLGWLLLSIAYAGYAVGDWTNAFYVLALNSQPPFPSVVDASYGIGNAVVLPALFLLGGRMLSSSRLRLMLDGGIIAGALLLISWLTVLRTVYHAGGGSSFLFALGLAYPISDIVLVVVAISTISQSRRLNSALLMVTVGILSWAFSDSAFAYLSAIGLHRTSYVVESGYFAGNLFIAVGSRIGREPRPETGRAAQLTRWQIVLPYVPMTLAFALVLWNLLSNQPLDLFSEVLAAAVTGLVLVRQLMAVVESQALTAALNRTLATLRHTAAEREILVDEAPVGICRLDRDGQLLAANQTFLDILGYSRGEIVGESFLRLLDREGREDDAASYQALADGRVNRLEREGRFIRKDGGFAWCSPVASVVRGVGGQAESFITIVEDISERRQQADRAAQIQRGLLPRAGLEIPGYELAGVCLPAQDVAGDFYDWVASDGHLDITVADVMGKGVGAALVMAVLRTALRSCPPVVEPAARVRMAADSMALVDEGLLVTLFHTRLDARSGLFRYVDAGHGYCAIRRADGELVHLPARSLPLGVRDDEVFSEGTAQLDPGDALILYSDGLVERDERTAALSELALGLGDSNDAADSVRRLMEKMPGRSTDDVTVVVLHRVPAAAGRLPAAAGHVRRPLDARL